jgi:hypothetical protein
VTESNAFRFRIALAERSALPGRDAAEAGLGAAVAPKLAGDPASRCVATIDATPRAWSRPAIATSPATTKGWPRWRRFSSPYTWGRVEL